MEVANSYEKLESNYQKRQRHIPEHSDLCLSCLV